MVNKINVGAKAPNFSLPDAENITRSLKEFLGQKVVLVFFIESFTVTSTKEVSEFRDSIYKMINLKAQIVGIDTKVPSVIRIFAEKNRLSFPILSDYKHKVMKMYGVKAPSIFILNEEGTLRYKWVSNEKNLEPNYQEIEKSLEYLTAEEQAPKVAHDVITISRQVGSGGNEIALKVCKILGFSYFDKNLMAKVAKDIGVCEGDITDFSEDSYKVKSFVDKILGRKQLIVRANQTKEITPIKKALDEEKCLNVIQTVINNLAGRGKTVIVGRGGQAILKNKVRVLHVRIIAPLDDRIKRIMKKEGVTKESALKLIQDSDKTSAEYLSRFYSINWEDPTIYNIILNTGKMDIDTASKIIVSMCLQA